jgi:hypothetical protein
LNKPDLDVYATHSEVSYGLAQKQDTISDLSTIRSGAAAGATAVQPSEMTSALAGKQDVISDLPAIRSGAAKGATSVQPADLAPYAVASDVESALAGKQDVISDLSEIRAGAQSGATAVQPATMNAALAGKQDVISDLSTIRSGAASGATAVQPATMNAALAGKQDVISDLADIRSGAAAGATAVQPGDLAPVATSGSYDDLTDKPSIPSFTQAQQAAIDSGIDATKVGLYDTHVGDLDIHVTPADKTAWNGKQDAISDLSTIRSGAAAGATAVQPSEMDAALADKQDVIQDLSTIRSGAAAGATAVQPADMASALADKQDVISDLSDIRSGAAAGATAVQPGDLATVATTGAYSDLSGTPTIPTVDQTYNASSANAQSGVAVAGAISGKQDVINDLATIRSGAAAGATAVQPGDLATVATTGSYDDLSDKPTIPAAQVNADWNAASGVAQILNKPTLATVATTGAFSDLSGKPTVDQTYDGTSANAQSGVAVAQAIAGVNAVPASTSADSAKVLTVNSIGTPEWASAQAPISAGNGIDITNNTVSAKVDGTTVTVNGSGQLQATQPTVDQTYNSSSANAQSGTAVAGAIAGKEDEFSAGDGLEFTTDGQGNRVLQVDTPVDIVAGPGIVVDNPDGNTLRVSVAKDLETVLYDGELKQVTNNTPVSGNVLSETFRNFKRVLLIGHTDDGAKCPFSILLEPLNSSGDMEWSVAVNNAGWCKWFCGKLNGTTITLTLGRVLTMGTANWDYLHDWTINKVVGINRIAGGN